MGCSYMFCHNTYAFSLLFYKVYKKRENAGSWNSRLEKAQTLETYSAQLQKPRNSTELRFRKYKNIWRKKSTRGATDCPRGWGALPLPSAPPASWASRKAPDAHLLLYEVF